MVPGILGKKIGMTQIFMEDGTRLCVTVLEAGPCQVQAIKTSEKDGYDAVQIGFSDAKEKRTKKPQREELKAKGLKPKKFVREIRCDEAPDVKEGDLIKNSIFQKGDFLDVTGTSKGKGFQGGMKRCGWAGGKDTHGSMSHRAPGSIGASSYPSRVVKGHAMPGKMGNERVTVQNVEVVDVDKDNNTILVQGAVPGANGTFLIMRYALKKPLAEREQIEEPVEEETVDETAAEDIAGDNAQEEQKITPETQAAEEAPAEGGDAGETKEEGKE
jgi:large subunit ribosomal protein L3